MHPRDPQQVSLPEGRWKRGKWCAGVCGHIRGGDVSTLRVGVRLLAGLCHGTLTRANLTREKRDHKHHSTHTGSAQHHSGNTRVAQAHDTHVHVANLAPNPRRYVPSAVRDAKRSNAKRSTARARDTCTTHTHNMSVRNTTVRTTLCTNCTRCALSARHHFVCAVVPSFFGSSFVCLRVQRFRRFLVASNANTVDTGCSRRTPLTKWHCHRCLKCFAALCKSAPWTNLVSWWLTLRVSGRMVQMVATARVRVFLQLFLRISYLWSLSLLPLLLSRLLHRPRLPLCSPLFSLASPSPGTLSKPVEKRIRSGKRRKVARRKERTEDWSGGGKGRGKRNVAVSGLVGTDCRVAGDSPELLGSPVDSDFQNMIATATESAKNLHFTDFRKISNVAESPPG